MSITESIELLKNYNGPLGLTLHNAASEELINEVENTYGIALPADFKSLYRFTDGFETVEDIFNMIPLAEIVDNKKRYNEDPLYIAEYMIYSDMWQLEVDAENPDQYLISIKHHHEDRLVLTNSLGEFIARFLKGGVFELGGLYAWADEIKAKLFGNTDPLKIKPLLWLFRECLKRGLKTKQEVVDWADWIIATEDRPHHFFIEMSTSHNLNDLISVLNSAHLDEDISQVRVLFGTMYTLLLIDKIETDKVISILSEYSRDERLTRYEKAKIMGLIVDADYLDDKIFNRKKLKMQLMEKVKDFFHNYWELGQHSHPYWEKINANLIEKFDKME